MTHVKTNTLTPLLLKAEILLVREYTCKDKDWLEKGENMIVW